MWRQEQEQVAPAVRMRWEAVQMLKGQLVGLGHRKGSGLWQAGQMDLKMVAVGQRGKLFVKVDRSQPVGSSMAVRTLKPQRVLGSRSVRTEKRWFVQKTDRSQWIAGSEPISG